MRKEKSLYPVFFFLKTNKFFCKKVSFFLLLSVLCGGGAAWASPNPQTTPTTERTDKKDLKLPQKKSPSRLVGLSEKSQETLTPPSKLTVTHKKGEGLWIDLLGDQQWMLLIGGLAFTRLEAQANRNDMNSQKDDSDYYIGTRMRLTLGARLLKHIELRMTVQDARFWGSGLPTQGKIRFRTDTNTEFAREVFLGFSLFEGYVALERPWDLPVRIEAGRMILEYGRGYILGDPAYAVQGQSFDTVRIRWMPHNWTVDLFWSKIRANVERVDAQTCKDGCFFEGDDLVSLYAVGKLHESFTLHLYGMFYYRTPLTAEPAIASKIGIFGTRLEWALGGWKGGLELVLETGSWLDQTLLAFSALLETSYTFAGSWKPTLGFQFMTGSGDGDDNDGMQTAYQPMLSRRRRFYGMVGLFSPSNLIQPAVSFSVSPHATVTVQASVRQSFLWDSRGAIVSAAHTFFARNTAGGPNVLGMEWNLAVMWRPYPFLLFDAVGGVYLPTVGNMAGVLKDSAGNTLGSDPAWLGYLRAWLEF
ncbi:MAG: alginate export family protein [Myxococcales bacterium]|nr:alginate export family protein [Myxococcales bacterium]